MPEKAMTLDQLKRGQEAIVTRVKSRGLDRRRLMDLGILPDTAIRVEMGNPLGDPIAYQIRGSVIALRNSQARNVEVIIHEKGADEQ